jgi:hypothetical protein
MQRLVKEQRAERINLIMETKKLTMERNTATTIGRLKIGDRFYKPSDKKKEVWQYISFSNKKFNCKRDRELHPSPLSMDTQIIFLRNDNI